MNENLRTAAIEGEAPVNPYSLLEAVNSASTAAHRSLLLFVAAMLYLLVTVAGVTHADLLLAGPVMLPLLGVEVELTQFFLAAPISFVLLHLGILMQVVVLARKAREFDAAMRMLEATDRRTHPLRLELRGFFPVQAIAGPERSLVMGAVLHAMTWLVLVIMPVALLLYVQVTFLPYHDAGITWAHRFAFAADVLILILLGPFALQPETSFLRAAGGAIRAHPLGLIIASAALGLLAAFSFLIATIPGEPLDRLAQSLTRPAGEGAARRGEQAAGPAMPGLGLDGLPFAVFQRNLEVTDLVQGAGRDAAPGAPGPMLRGRDLRFARLDRSDLRRADMTGADLDGASLVGADLRGAHLHCADGNALAATQDRKAAHCVSARGANLARANLRDARMAGIDLTGARLEEADLHAADLRQAVLAGAGLRGAQLQRAHMTGGIAAQAADFARASLQGADLAGARLTGADFTGAGLQGVTLAQAGLLGATLRKADLEAADLGQARLHGADLRGAMIRAADLRGAMLWMTAAPDGDTAAFADLSQLVVSPIEQAELAGLEQALAGISAERRSQVREALAPLLAAEAGKPWTDGADQQSWQALGAASAASAADNYKSRLTDHLARLACSQHWADGSVATGVARRALAPQFKGDMPVLYDRLKADDCPASKAMPPHVLRSLAAAADRARGN